MTSITSGMNIPPIPQSGSQAMHPQAGMQPTEGMQAGSRPQGPPPGGMPPGMEEVLSENDLNEARTILDSLTEEQLSNFQTAMESLHNTAEKEDYSLVQVADSFLKILEEVSGNGNNTDNIIDVVA